MIKINLPPFLIDQKIPIFNGMTFVTGQHVPAQTVIQLNVAMGKEDTVLHLDRLVVVAHTAAETGDLILAGQNLEGTSLILFFGLNRLDRQGICRGHFHTVERLGRMFNLVLNRFRTG